jgi:hypothetical protein
MQEVTKARAALNALRGFIRRKGTTGWVERSAKFNYQAAYAAVVAVEDVLGVEDPTSIQLADRLLQLRREAQAAGLLNYSEIAAAERAAVGA